MAARGIPEPLRTTYRTLTFRVGTSCLALLVAGCLAQGARPEAMVPTGPMPSAPDLPASLVAAMEVGLVSGGEPTNPLWTSEVDNESFERALRLTLGQLGLLAPPDGTARYRLDANIVDVEQPLMGFDTKVTSTVAYDVTPLGGGRRFSTFVVAPYTATVADSLGGVERLRLANEGSMQANIRDFVDQLLEFYRHEAMPSAKLELKG